MERVVFLVLFAVPALADLPTFPNIDYLGRGYDLVQANAKPSIEVAFDPGWKDHNLFLFSYDENHTTGDRRFALPNSVDVLNTGACVYSASSQEITSSYKYQQSFQEDVSISGNVDYLLVKAAFSGSTDYKNAAQSTASQSSTYLSTQSVCDFYHASFRPYHANPPSVDLAKAVQEMPTSVNATTLPWFVAFAKNWGTHYTTEIEMGGKATSTMVYDTAAYSSMKSQGIDVKAAASVSYGIFGGVSASSQTQANQENYNAFKNTTFKSITSCTGGRGRCPVLSTGATGAVVFDNDWSDKVRDDPLPIQYVLASVDTLLTTEMFPSDNSTIIAAKQAALYSFYVDHYCGQVAKCDPPLPSQYWQQVADVGRAASPTPGSPVKIANAGVASLGTKLYAVGGYQMPSTWASAQRYDPSTNGWTTLTSMSTTRANLGVAALGAKIYAVGGYDDADNDLASAEVYDPRTNTWAAIASMSTVRYYLGVAALGSKLYAVGGLNALSDPLASGEVYDPSADAWTTIANMSVRRNSFGLAAFGTKIYAVGGSGLGSAEVYDPSTNAWTSIQGMSTPRANFGLAVLGTKLYAVGGRTGTSSVEMYDPSTNTWAIAGSMRLDLAHIGAASLMQPVIGETLFIVGGCEPQPLICEPVASTMYLVDENYTSMSASADPVGPQAWWV